MRMECNNPPNSTDNFYGIPYTIIQILLSVLIPLLIFYLGIKATIKSLKKKELARLIVLKEYYYLWVKDILGEASKQNKNYRQYCIDLYKLDYLDGVPYQGVDLPFERLNNIDNKDLYKVFMELNKNDAEKNAKKFIKLSKNLLFVNSVTNQLKDEHIRLINYLTELRDKWNKQMEDLRIVKDNLVKARNNPEVPESFFNAVNTEFNTWYDIPGYSGLRQTYNFVKRMEKLTKSQYNLTPSLKVVSDLLFAVQALTTTCMMFRVYRLQIFKMFKSYYKNLAITIHESSTLIEDLKQTPNTTWKHIKSYQ